MNSSLPAFPGRVFVMGTQQASADSLRPSTASRHLLRLNKHQVDPQRAWKNLDRRMKARLTTCTKRRLSPCRQPEHRRVMLPCILVIQGHYRDASQYRTRLAYGMPRCPHAHASLSIRGIVGLAEPLAMRRLQCSISRTQLLSCFSGPVKSEKHLTGQDV